MENKLPALSNDYVNYKNNIIEAGFYPDIQTLAISLMLYNNNWLRRWTFDKNGNKSYLIHTTHSTSHDLRCKSECIEYIPF